MNWRHYIPALGSFGAALFMLAFPFVAVFLVVGALFTFGGLYAAMIYKIHQLQKRDAEAGPEINVTYQEMSPNFRDVTSRMSRQMGLFRDVN